LLCLKTAANDVKNVRVQIQAKVVWLFNSKGMAEPGDCSSATICPTNSMIACHRNHCVWLSLLVYWARKAG